MCDNNVQYGDDDMTCDKYPNIDMCTYGSSDILPPNLTDTVQIDTN